MRQCQEKYAHFESHGVGLILLFDGEEREQGGKGHHNEEGGDNNGSLHEVGQPRLYAVSIAAKVRPIGTGPSSDNQTSPIAQTAPSHLRTPSDNADQMRHYMIWPQPESWHQPNEKQRTGWEQSAASRHAAV